MSCLTRLDVFWGAWIILYFSSMEDLGDTYTKRLSVYLKLFCVLSGISTK